MGAAVRRGFGLGAAYRRHALLVAAGGCLSSPSLAEIRLAVGSVVAANKQTAPIEAQKLESALRSASADAAEKARERGCQVAAIDISRESIRGRETERMLQKRGYSPEDGVKIGKIVVSDIVSGVVGFNGNGGHDYMVEVTNFVTNKVVARVSGEMTDSSLFDAARKIMESIVEQACKTKPYRLQARYKDLDIDHLICDLSKPFNFNARGQTAGIRFTLTPSSANGGGFSLAGPAAGVQCSGGGNYTVALNEGGGTLDMTGSWKITTPMGIFHHSTIPGKLTAFSSTHCSTPTE